MTTGYIRYIHLWFPLILSVKVVYVYIKLTHSSQYVATYVDTYTYMVSFNYVISKYDTTKLHKFSAYNTILVS